MPKRWRYVCPNGDFESDVWPNGRAVCPKCGAMLKRKSQTPEQRLNADELEVIRLLVTGLNGSEIARKQKVDTDRVYQNLRTARSKLGVQTIAQLAAECVRRKIVA